MVKDAMRVTTGIVTDDAVDSDNADLALKVLRDVKVEDLVIDDATSGELLKKIDRNMMPVSPSRSREIFADLRFSGSVHRLRTELSRQNDVDVCIYHGLDNTPFRGRHWSSWSAVQLACKVQLITIFLQTVADVTSVFYFGYLIGEWPTTVRRFSVDLQPHSC